MSQSWTERFQALEIHSQDVRLQRFYGAGCVGGDTEIAATPFVALDFETTGLDARQDAIVSIGLVPFSLQRVFLRDACEWLVKPEQPLQEESVVVHGITHSEVRSAPDLDRIVAPLLDAMAGKVVVVHHQRIEREFLNQALLERLNEGIEFPLIDTMELEQRALRARQGLVGRLLKRPLGSLRLGDCRQRYSLPFYSPHHALTDAIATAELLLAQVAYQYRPDTPVSELWC
ncbi:DNA polymerase III subunit epsilon [Bacterioplanes sanyensis]|uniref:DNA polymerase III subunit epsilon n=1 Tax=Bacterioplanes sanyensis TaxID=1249553 RepID=A0A222FL67_9GAMM|nr:3'-5' exonuclease [Bacterioplanes sanyensis]ASP38963.1 DNA polymerase III subunit epsilon [Bacterioplanes sanyensis]